ncbi:ABC transporter permease [Williamsia sp. M5A3_1d]
MVTTAQVVRPASPLVRRVVPRIVIALITLLIASMLIFGVLRLIPGDPAGVLAGADADDSVRQAIRQQLGLDRPAVVDYFHWLGGILTGDLGRSYVIGGGVGDLVASAAGNTLVLATTATVLAVVIALVLSLAAVLTTHRVVGAVVTGVGALSIAVPTFVTGVVLVQVFAVVIPVLPAGGTPRDGLLSDPWVSLQFLFLPALCLALPVSSALSRFLVESLRTELAKPYTLAARAAGVGLTRAVVFGALRNALPDTVAVLGIQVGQLIGSSILVEAIFAWPGLGQLLAQGISARDYPVVQAALLVSVAAFILAQTLAEIVRLLLDPTLRNRS